MTVAKVMHAANKSNRKRASLLAADKGCIVKTLSPTLNHPAASSCGARRTCDGLTVQDEMKYQLLARLIAWSLDLWPCGKTIRHPNYMQVSMHN